MLINLRNALMTGKPISKLAVLWNGNGGTAYAACPNYSARGFTNASFGCWVYFPSSPAGIPFVGWASTGSWGGFSIGAWGDSFYFRGASSAASLIASQITQNKWMHVFTVKSSSSVSFYIDGVAVATKSCPATLGTNVATRFKIVRGTYADRDTQATDQVGKVALAGVCAFTRALSASEVQSIYANKMLVDESVAPFNNGLLLGYNLTSDIVASEIPNDKSGGYPLSVYDGQYTSMGIPFNP